MKHILKRLLVVILVILYMTPMENMAETTDPEPLFPIRENGLWGYMNRQGETVISPQWRYVETFDGDTAVVGLKEHENDLATGDYDDGLIDRQGHYLIEPGHNYCIADCEDIYVVWYYSAEDYSGAGFYDKASGFYQQPLPEYDWIMNWGSDGSGPIAVRNRDYMTGYVDRGNGDTVIPFRYSGESDDVEFHDGYAYPADEVYIVDSNQKILAMGMKYHLIDAEGNELQFDNGMQPGSAVYDGIFIYSMDLSETNNNDPAYIQLQYGGFGNEVAFPLYEMDPRTKKTEPYTDSFWNDDAVVGLGIARIDGTLLSEPDTGLDKIWEPDEDGMLCILKRNDEGDYLCGHMDMDGNVLVQPRYRIKMDSLPYYFFRNGYAVLEDMNGHDTRWVIMDHYGNELFTISRDAEDGAYLSLENVEEGGMLWYRTNKVEQEKRDGIWRYIWTDCHYGVMRVSGTMVATLTGPIYDDHGSYQEGLCAVKTDGFWGYIDENATWIISSQYDTANSFRNGLALVEKDEKLQYIDHDGIVVWKEQ